MSRAADDDAFRLAFTRLVLDRYGELADTASSLAPRIDTHAVVVEAIRMVDESQPAVDQASGNVARIVPRAEWLADWVTEAIRYISETPSGHEARLGRKRSGWQERHTERLDLHARLEGLGPSREAAVLTLLGWDDMDAVVALAGHGDQTVGVSVEGYRALASDGITRLAGTYDEPRLDDPEYRLGYLRWRLEVLMPPLAWVTQHARPVFDQPDMQSAEVEAADIVALTEPDPVAPEAEEPLLDDVVEDEATVVDVPVIEPVAVAAGGLTGWTWSDEELVALSTDGQGTVAQDRDGDEEGSDLLAVPAGGRRARVLAVAGVVATMAIGAGALLAPRPQGVPAAVPTTGQATGKHVPAAKRSTKPKRAVPTSSVTGRGAAKATSARQTSPKAKTTPPVVSRSAAPRRPTYVPVSKSASSATRSVRRPAPVTNADIQAEFLP